MIKNVELTIEHIKRKASKTKNYQSLNEIIWNAIDADADNVYITIETSESLGQKYVQKIIVKDDGHGLNFSDIDDNLIHYGKTQKVLSSRSPKGRLYHGKAGEGRYTYYSLGTSVSWESNYVEGAKHYSYKIIFNNDKTTLDISNLKESTSQITGLTVTVQNIVASTQTDFLDIEKIKQSIIKEFAPCLFAYENINIFINNEKINFASAIKTKKEYSFSANSKNFVITFVIWEKIKSNELYYCGQNGAVYLHSSFKNLTNNVTSYLKSPYFDELKINGMLDAFELQEECKEIYDKVEEFFMDFAKKSDAEINSELIEELRADEVYPFKEIPKDDKEAHKKIVFDIVTSQIRKLSPKIGKGNRESRKLTYNLIKAALNTNPSSLTKILTDVFNLTKEQQDQFAKLLDDISLPSIISTIKEVDNRLYFLDELTKIVYDEPGNHIKERTRFQKILIDQIWLFGDKYTYGVDDVNLRNVLKAHCKHLGMNDIELTKNDYQNKDLNKIPDIVLWRNNLYGDKYENLVIEIKRPNKKLDSADLEQIKKYALSITSDSRFSKNNTQWHFMLIGNDFDSFVEAEAMATKKNHNMYGFAFEIIKWSDLISDNRLKYEFFKKASAISITEDKVKKSINERWRRLFGKDDPSPFENKK